MITGISETIAGDTLLDVLREGGSLADRLPETGGLYIWTRRLCPPDRVTRKPEKLRSWLEQESSRTQRVFESSLAHVGHITLRLGDGALGREKERVLADYLHTGPQVRRGLSNLLAAFDFTQVLYVGEAADLATRIAQHLRGQSGFGKRVAEFGFQWEQLGVRIVEMPMATAAERCSVERLMAMLTLAPVTYRAG